MLRYYNMCADTVTCAVMAVGAGLVYLGTIMIIYPDDFYEGLLGPARVPASAPSIPEDDEAEVEAEPEPAPAAAAKPASRPRTPRSARRQA